MSDATASSIATDFDLGPIDQISFAVTSIEQSLPWYEALFGAPFTVRDVTLSPDAVRYRGAPADAALRLAFGRTAGIEIERIVEERQEAGPHQQSFNTSRLASGAYLYRLKTDSGEVARQMIVEH